MSEIVFSRVDARLIHGQVMTKWLKVSLANKIVIIDEYLSKESFMVDIYRLSAPSDIEVEIISPEKIIEFLENEKDKANKIFLLYKDIFNAYSAFKNGLKFNFLQLGGIPKDETRKSIYNAVCLNDDEFNKIKEMNEKGIEVCIQIIPEEKRLKFEDIEKLMK